MSFWYSIWSQNGLNISAIGIDFLIEYSFLFLWGIVTIVVGMLSTVVSTEIPYKEYLEMPILELAWTVLPGVVLLFVALPSLELLYIMENKVSQNITIKVTGHQWYWSYDYFNKINFDSFIERSRMNSIRIIEVDNHVVLPIGKISAIISSEDVLHRWRLPSLGVKTDANPGRLNSTRFNLFLPGLYYGHCSEICGANHSFIPIVVESTTFTLFRQWVATILGKQ